MEVSEEQVRKAPHCNGNGFFPFRGVLATSKIRQPYSFEEVLRGPSTSIAGAIGTSTGLEPAREHSLTCLYLTGRARSRVCSSRLLSPWPGSGAFPRGHADRAGLPRREGSRTRNPGNSCSYSRLGIRVRVPNFLKSDSHTIARGVLAMDQAQWPSPWASDAYPFFAFLSSECDTEHFCVLS